MADNLLYDTKKALINITKSLPEIEVNNKKTNRYENYDITVLADNYCKATDEKDEYSRNLYISALLLRFWYVIDRMFYKLRGTDFDRLDVFNKLYECIEVACQYRAWQDPTKHTNAQACINQVLSSRGVPAMIAEYNQKHHMKCAISLDEQIDNDIIATRSDLLADDTASESCEAKETSSSLIQSLINDNKVIEAIIADNIANGDVFKYFSKLIKATDFDGNEYNYTQNSSEFWPFKLVKELNALDDAYYKSFAKMYYIKDDKLQPARVALAKASNSKKYKYIDAAKETLKKYYIDLI